MLADISLTLIFFGSAFILWRLASEKLPAVVSVPEDSIREQLRKDWDRNRIYIFLVHFRALWRERYFHGVFFSFLGKILQKIHIFLLRADNGVMNAARKFRSGENANAQGNGDYWNTLRRMGESPERETETDENADSVQKRSVLSQLRDGASVITVIPERMTAFKISEEKPHDEIIPADSSGKPFRKSRAAPRKTSRRGGQKKKKREVPPT